jgi:hypothetical protein
MLASSPDAISACLRADSIAFALRVSGRCFGDGQFGPVGEDLFEHGHDFGVELCSGAAAEFGEPSSIVLRGAYGRLEITASKESQTAMIREPRGIFDAGQRIGGSRGRSALRFVHTAPEKLAQRPPSRSGGS